MMKLFLVLVFVHIALFTASGADNLPPQFRLIPHPQKIELLNGVGLKDYDLRSLCLMNFEKRPVMSGDLDKLNIVLSPGPGTLTLKIVPGLNLPSPEGYVLEVSSGQALVQAEAPAGIFYGIQTLKQLLEDAYDQRIEIPACRITDFPAVSYRAIHLDLKHHLDAMQYYYDLIDRLASVKVNAVIIEFEDKLRYREAPAVGAGHAVSVEEFAALSNYARERYIEISPLVQGLGHASFILKHEQYKLLRDDPASDWVFDPLHPGTYELQFSLYKDAMAATPQGRYLHVGGDEVGSLGKSQRSVQSGMSALELQMHWLQKVADFAQAHGRIPIFWDDMVFKLSGLYETTYDPAISPAVVEGLWKKNAARLEENISLFPKECVYMRWNYDTPKLPGNIKALEWYKSHGLHVMAATAAQQIWPMLPRNRSNFQAIKDFCEITAERNLDGILCTIWDDTSPHFETVWRGIYDFSLFSWNPQRINVNEAHEMFRHRFYSASLADTAYAIQDLLEDALPFWETALLNEGHRRNYPASIKLIDLPSAKSGEWSKRYAGKILSARNALHAASRIEERIGKAKRLARRNFYTLEVMDQINKLQVYPAKLLLLLEKYDKASVKEKEAVAKTLRASIDQFKDLRAEFEAVYGRTRILGNPQGYKLDSNFHHHLANGTNTTDWMYVYELAMNDKLSLWLSQQVQNKNK